MLAGVLYGMGTQATAAKLGIDVARASSIISTFFDRFKQIKVWIQRVKRYDMMVLVEFVTILLRLNPKCLLLL
jgi:DNA polymerase I-like protein with 3'-5' exonuclease and polymerase domains